MTSRLLYQNKRYLLLDISISSSNDDWAEWQIDENGVSRYGRKFDQGWHHALDNLDLVVLVSKETGSIVRIVSDSAITIKNLFESELEEAYGK